MFKHDHTQQDLDLLLKEAQRHLTQLKYEPALELLVRARKIAWDLAATIYFTDLDRKIQRLRDQVTYHAQLSALTQHWVPDADDEVQLAHLQQLEQILSLISAMDYQSLQNAVRTIQTQLIATLGPGRSQELAQRAVEIQDYQLALKLLEGLQFNEGTSAATLFRRVREIIELEISPFLRQADEYLPQAQPMGAFGPLQDLRQKYPSCPAWRKPWFEAARRQGEYLLERGRQHLSDMLYKEAHRAFSDAYRAFSRAVEAYPEAHATQMLLTEAQDLCELSQEIAAAHKLLEAGQEIETFQHFDAIYRKLLEWEGEQREYTQQKYEVTLMRSRLQEQVQMLPHEITPSEQQSEVVLTSVDANVVPEIAPDLDKEDSMPIQLQYQQKPAQQEPVDQALPQNAQQQTLELRRLLRSLRLAIDEGNYEQGRILLEELEVTNVADEILDLYERILQAGLRLSQGKKLLQEGDIAAAQVRFGKAAELVKNCPEADILSADAQMWLERAQPQPSSAAITPCPALEFDTYEDGPLKRLATWTLNIEPFIAQVRAAFIRGEFELARGLFLTALEQITAFPEHLEELSTTSSEGDES